MRVQYAVGFYPRGQFLAARKLFRRMGRWDLADAEEAEFGYFFNFSEEADFIAFKAEAERLGFTDEHLSVRKDRIYSAAELRSAPLLWLVVRSAPKGYGGPTYGTNYDLSSACPRCGAGAVQISSLVLKRGETPRKGSIFETPDGEILASFGFGDRLREASLTGLELRQAISHPNSQSLPWLQLIANTELPPMSDLTRGVVRSRPCPECSRDGHYHAPPVEIVYDKNKVNVNGFPDAVHTYECFGNSVLREPFKDSHFAQPLILLKPRVFEVFEKSKVRSVEFIPLSIV